MPNMQSKHSILDYYLKRRSLLIASLQQPQPQKFNDQICLQNEQQFMVSFASACQKESIELKEMKQMIKSNYKWIKEYGKQILFIIQCMTCQHHPTQISKLLFYLCKNNVSFYGEVCEWLSMRKRRNYKQIIMLTNMFLYGIYFTEDQYLAVILSAQMTDHQTHQYILNFLYVLSSPQYFNKKNKEKIYSHFFAILKKNVHLFTLFKTQSLKQHLTQFHHAILDHETSKSRQQFETNFKREVQEFVGTHEELGMVINLIDDIQSQFETWLLMGKEKEDYRHLANEINEVEKDRELGRILRMERMEDLIEQIEEDLRYFPRHTQNLKMYSNEMEEQIYVLPTKQSQTTNKYFSDMEQFQFALSLCQTIEQSEILSNSFLCQLNINQNRREIVRYIFTLHKNNNLSYICRVLGLIRLKESEINLHIEEKFKLVKGCDKFVKNQPILTQLLKLKIIGEDKLLDLLCWYGEEMDLEQIIKILQNLGKPIYYSNISAHIKMNDIFQIINNRIRKSNVDLSFINKFHGLITYLHKHELKSQFQSSQKNPDILKIFDDQLTQKNMSSYVKKFTKKIKENKTQQLSSALQLSISNRDYMSTYYYAELVNRVNSKKFDRVVANMVKKQMEKKIEEEDSQGAANWGRFFGELFISEIISQRQFTEYVDGFFCKYFKTNENGTVKVICSAIQACKRYLMETRSIKSMNDTLLLLMKIKESIMKANGLSNKIIQNELADIIEYFNPALIQYFNRLDEIILFKEKLEKKPNVEELLNKMGQQKQGIKYVEVKKNNSTPETRVEGQKSRMKVICRAKDGSKKLRTKQISIS